MPETFFDEKQSAAVLKHAILGRYLAVFSNKAGSGAPGKRVAYLDGYAGPGVYDDGGVGSPALAAATAEKLAAHRNLLGIYVEAIPGTAAKLENYLSGTQHSHEVLKGTLDERLDDALALAGKDVPLFAFVDPFGLAIPMDRLALIMDHSLGPHGGPPTEVLLNFSYAGLRRNAGHLTSRSKNYRGDSQARLVERTDRTMGGDWWHPIWESEADDRISRIAREYAQQFTRRTSARGWYLVPVSPRWEGRAVYDLMLFTRSPAHGFWNFNNCVSKAFEEYYQFCIRLELDLDPEDERRERWVAVIKDNLTTLLRERRQVSVEGDLDQIFGTTLGYAREMHLRAAIKQLHAEGITPHNGVGDLQKAVLTAKPRRRPQP